MSWAAFERTAYQAARNWEMQPSEFWRLPLCDFWAEMDSKIEEGRRLKEMTEDIRKPTSGANVFSREEWALARKRHREKMDK